MRTGILIEGTELKKNIVRDTNNKITTGIAIGESDAQNVQLNIQMMPGDLKGYPTIGCGIYQYINGFIDMIFYRKAAISLKADGYDIKDVEFVTE